MAQSYAQTMDFFGAQRQARRWTFWLVLFFTLAIVCITIGVYFVLLPFFYAQESASPASLWNPACAATAVIFMAALIGLTSLVKVLQLRKGGAAVARAVGAVPYNSIGLHRVATLRLKNVVEEMAIASGCPQPDVFVLPREEGINAFAAGWTPDNAAIAVTNGSLRYLDRDELQGVVAHEFSHIVYGDMRLNCRILATITGLFALSVLGRLLIEIGLRLLRVPRGARKKNDAGAIGLAFLLVGAAFWLLGLIGVFCGRLIQAAISRQREYLADASAVQFTRNPDGIAGALKKIGGFSLHGRVSHPRATELAHMFFADFRRYLAGLMATHPPLEERIRRIDPSFDGRFPAVQELVVAESEIPVPAEAPLAAAAAFAATPSQGGKEQEKSRMEAETEPVFRATPDLWLGRVGRPGKEELNYARDLFGSLPAALIEATRDPVSAMGLVYALLIDPDLEVRRRQLEYLQSVVPPVVYEETMHALQLLKDVQRDVWLPLAQLCLPAIGQLPPEQVREFASHVLKLIREDGKLSLFEFCIAYGVVEPLLLRIDEVRRRRTVSKRRAIPHIIRLTAVLARLGHIRPDEEENAFKAAIQQGIPDSLRPREVTFPPREQCTLAHAGESLKVLRQADLETRRIALQCAVTCALYDGKVTLAEAESLRAIAATLGLPVPPVVQHLRKANSQK